MTANADSRSGHAEMLRAARRQSFHFQRRADDDRRHDDGIDHQPANQATDAVLGPSAAGLRKAFESTMPYRATNVCSDRGSLRSMKAAVGSAARISHGVSSVVMPETATAMEYSKFVGRAGRDAERGDNEREFADLRQAHAGLHRSAERFAR